MPKFRIDLQQTVTEGCFVVVEADDEEAAEARALELAFSDNPKDDAGDPIVWSFNDTISPAEIVGIEEWPPVNDPDPPPYDHATRTGMYDHD